MTQRRNRWPRPTLLVLLVGMPVLETFLLVRTARVIGVLPTLLVLLAEAALATWLLRREGSRAWRQLTGALVSGRIPARELTDAALILVGAVLLMLPGFVSDLVGLVFLLPFTRGIARTIVEFFTARKVSYWEREADLGRARTDPGMTIDGEVVDEPHNTGSSSTPGPDGQEPPAITGEVI